MFEDYKITGNLPVTQIFICNKQLDMADGSQLTATRHTPRKDSPVDWDLTSEGNEYGIEIKSHKVSRIVVTSPESKGPLCVIFSMKPKSLKEFDNNAFCGRISSLEGPDCIVVVLDPWGEVVYQDKQENTHIGNYEQSIRRFRESFSRDVKKSRSSKYKTIEFITDIQRDKITKYLGLEKDGFLFKKVRNVSKSPVLDQMLYDLTKKSMKDNKAIDDKNQNIENEEEEEPLVLNGTLMLTEKEEDDIFLARAGKLESPYRRIRLLEAQLNEKWYAWEQYKKDHPKEVSKWRKQQLGKEKKEKTTEIAKKNGAENMGEPSRKKAKC